MLPATKQAILFAPCLWLDDPKAFRRIALMCSFTAASSAPTSAAISDLLLTGLQQQKDVSFWICQGTVLGVVEIGREWRPICAGVLSG